MLAGTGLVLLAPVLALIAALLWWESGAPIFRQVRVGRDGQPFVLYKFRTMRVGTPQVATHMVPATAVTPLGRWLRRTKLDELPQLLNVLKGEMSLVGPRPCLPSQVELIVERARRGVLAVRPGVTGLAQVRGVDMSVPRRLARWDAHLVRQLDAALYWRCLCATLRGHGQGDRVR